MIYNFHEYVMEYYVIPKTVKYRGYVIYVGHDKLIKLLTEKPQFEINFRTIRTEMIDYFEKNKYSESIEVISKDAIDDLVKKKKQTREKTVRIICQYLLDRYETETTNTFAFFKIEDLAFRVFNEKKLNHIYFKKNDAGYITFDLAEFNMASYNVQLATKRQFNKLFKLYLENGGKNDERYKYKDRYASKRTGKHKEIC